jgi:hypothetical protein
LPAVPLRLDTGPLTNKGVQLKSSLI